jgi:hypothetical protein
MSGVIDSAGRIAAMDPLHTTVFADWIILQLQAAAEARRHHRPTKQARSLPPWLMRIVRQITVFGPKRSPRSYRSGALDTSREG